MVRGRLLVTFTALACAQAGPDVVGGSGEVEDVGGSTEVDSSTSTTSASTTNCATAGCVTVTSEATADTGDPLPPNELQCDDDLDDDGDGLTDCFDANCWTNEICSDRFVRVATWNVRLVGAPGSTEHEALLRVLGRIDADIVCLEEVGDDEDDALDALARAAGYPFVAAIPASGGMIRNACLSRHEILQWHDLQSSDLSSDIGASELARGFLRMRVRLEAVDRYLTVLAVHLKADVTDTDRFRRMVEAVRLGVAIEVEREAYPYNAIIAMGDFNETPDYPRGLVFDEPPADLPFSYQLGNDIALPLPYAPFDPIEAEDVEVIDAVVEDTQYRDTYLPGLVRLDYIYEDAGDVVASEVYEACEDDGVDGNPEGDRMPKAGDPLPCGTNGDASDHRPVVAMFYFE